MIAALLAVLALAWAGVAWGAAIRSVEELRLLTDAELRAEGVEACRAVTTSRDGASRATDPWWAVLNVARVAEWGKYLERIGLVARERSWWWRLLGKYPRWWEDLRAAAEGHVEARCLDVRMRP